MSRASCHLATFLPWCALGPSTLHVWFQILFRTPTGRATFGVQRNNEPNTVFLQMGPSGSSKTTLLDVLAGRKTVGTITGKILFAGQRGTRTFLRRYTGYVEQFGAPLCQLLTLLLLMEDGSHA